MEAIEACVRAKIYSMGYFLTYLASNIDFRYIAALVDLMRARNANPFSQIPSSTLLLRLEQVFLAFPLLSAVSSLQGYA